MPIPSPGLLGMNPRTSTHPAVMTEDVKNKCISTCANEAQVIVSLTRILTSSGVLARDSKTGPEKMTLVYDKDLSYFISAIRSKKEVYLLAVCFRLRMQTCLLL